MKLLAQMLAALQNKEGQKKGCEGGGDGGENLSISLHIDTIAEKIFFHEGELNAAIG